jgi:hypothetical protein
MLLVQSVLLLALLIVCCFAPGFFFVRRLRWSALEKLCGAAGLSLIILYLAGWASYCSGSRGPSMPVHALPFVAVSLVAAGLGAASWKDAVRLVRNAAARRAILGYGFLLPWCVMLLAIIRVYSGAGWSRDWLEHFQRTLFFLYHYPANTVISINYALPARPPMMNVLASFFLAQTKDRFELYQLVFTFLNLLLFLPCCLMMTSLGRPGKRRTLLLVAIFAMSPVLMEACTYSWTKALAAFYVVLALWFYLAGWRKNDGLRTIAAFVSLAAGLLVHYSAGPYVVFLAAHYLWRVFPKRRNRWKELAGIAVVSGLLLATWFGWSVAVFGVKGTLLTNSSVRSSEDYQGSTLTKISLNLYDTVVPALLRNPDVLRALDQPSLAGFVRDRAFVFYQLNLLFNMGLVGGPLVLWLLYWTMRHRRAEPPPAAAAPPTTHSNRGARRVAERSQVRTTAKARNVSHPKLGREQRFWLAAIPCLIVLGIAVVGERDMVGVPHLTLLPMVALGMTLLAAVVPWHKRTFAMLLIAGCAVDFSLGVLLQVRVEGEENTPHQVVFTEPAFMAGRLGRAPDLLSSITWENWYTKHYEHLTSEWLQRLPREYGTDPAFQKQWPPFWSELSKQRDAVVREWYGWWERNGGEVVYLGDDVAGSEGTGTNIATALVLLVWAGLMAALLRQSLGTAVRSGVPSGAAGTPVVRSAGGTRR